MFSFLSVASLQAPYPANGRDGAQAPTRRVKATGRRGSGKGRRRLCVGGLFRLYAKFAGGFLGYSRIRIIISLQILQGDVHHRHKLIHLLGLILRQLLNLSVDQPLRLS
jgi:hypothetical protein